MAKLLVWGGFWEQRTRPLALEELNSHASVTCYFLSEALGAHYQVVQIPGFDSIETALEHDDAAGLLSCFQAGFTRLREKAPEAYRDVRRAFAGRMSSIVDFVSLRRYAEDRLFTVLPEGGDLRERVKHVVAGAQVAEMGWRASPERCRPVEREAGAPFTVFLDHGHYAGADHTPVFIEALGRLAQSGPELRVLAQTNRGIEAIEPGAPWRDEAYRRDAKVRWIDLQDAYAQTDLFCVTHVESAGLGVIEAAMAGARILTPEQDGRSFINPRLLATGIDHLRVACDADSVAAAIDRARREGVDRSGNHRRLAESHAWSRGAKAIADALAA